MSLKKRELVRRNVTLHEFAADNLKRMSDFTGYTQGEIIEMALNQPIMERLKAFTSSENPIVSLLEAYQCDEGHMSRRVGESILQCVKDWVEKNAKVKDVSALSRVLPDTNSYISGHVTGYAMDADDYFSTIHDTAEEGNFLTDEMSADMIREKVIIYINAVINGANDKRIIMESYLFRNLLIILKNCFEVPADEDVVYMFHELSDGYVLPYMR